MVGGLRMTNGVDGIDAAADGLGQCEIYCMYLRNCSKKISPIAIELPVVLNGMKLIQ